MIKNCNHVNRIVLVSYLTINHTLKKIILNPLQLKSNEIIKLMSHYRSYQMYLISKN